MYRSVRTRAVSRYAAALMLKAYGRLGQLGNSSGVGNASERVVGLSTTHRCDCYLNTDR